MSETSGTRFTGPQDSHYTTSPINNAEWGRTISIAPALRSRIMYDNRPEETKYIYTDDDSQGKQLDGQNTYMVTFAKGGLPPVNGFWSLTLYNAERFFNSHAMNRYSLGTKNKTLTYNSDGSPRLYAGSNHPAKTKKVVGSLHPTDPFPSTFAPTGRAS